MHYRLGIDFGTSNTVAGYAGPDGHVHPLVFDGAPALPSSVCLDDSGGLLVGTDAVHAARVHPESYEPHPKRRIDEETALLGGSELPVVELIAAVLRRVATEARRVTGTDPAATVLTYPAAWAGTRRGRLALAAERAGLPRPTLVPEPVAAAASFLAPTGAGRSDSVAGIPTGACVVVYDLGGGTFDASVVRRGPSGLEVLATEGLEETGGLDIDAAVIGYFGTVFTPRHGAAWQRLVSPATGADRRAHRLLWEDVRAGKEMLSRTSSTVIHLPLIEQDAPLGRAQFDDLARPILDRTVAATRAALATAGVPRSEVSGIFLVGGASRIPLVATLLHQAFGMPPTLFDQPETVVAKGSLAVPGPPGGPVGSGGGTAPDGYPAPGAFTGSASGSTPVSGVPMSGVPMSGVPASGGFPPARPFAPASGPFAPASGPVGSGSGPVGSVSGVPREPATVRLPPAAHGATVPPPVPAWSPGPGGRPGPAGGRPRRSGGGPLWALVALLVVLLAGATGAFLVLRDGADDEPGGGGPTGTTAFWAGEWAGDISQPGHNPYSVTLKLHDADVGSVIGEVSYSPLGCSGTWTLTAEADNEIQAVEKITRDPRSACVGTVPFRVQRTSAGKLFVRFYRGPDPTGDPIGTGTLARR